MYLDTKDKYYKLRRLNTPLNNPPSETPQAPKPEE
jgi:hypothetical protein